jgi:hypothetical protein
MIVQQKGLLHEESVTEGRDLGISSLVPTLRLDSYFQPVPRHCQMHHREGKILW